MSICPICTDENSARLEHVNFHEINRPEGYQLQAQHQDHWVCKPCADIALALSNECPKCISLTVNKLKRQASAENIMELIKRQRRSGSATAGELIGNSNAEKESTSTQSINAFRKNIEILGIDPDNPIPDLESKCEWKGDLGLTLTAFRLPSTAVLTWKQGPNAGKIYDVVTVPKMHAPNKEEFLKGIDKGLHDVKAGILNARKFWTKLHLDYWGADTQPGLQYLRFGNKELNQLISEIERTGTGTWLEKRNQELDLHETYSYSDDEDDDVYIRYLFNKGMPDGLNRFFQSSGVTDLSDMDASHITYSEALDGIINAGALLSSNMRKEKGLLSVSGEGGRGNYGYTSKAVSFSLFDKTGKFLSSEFGSASGFSYPINFLINNENLKKLEISEGTLGASEGTIENEVPLSLINAVSVPSFAMAGIQRILAQHGYSHIKIFPLTTKVQ